MVGAPCSAVPIYIRWKEGDEKKEKGGKARKWKGRVEKGWGEEDEGLREKDVERWKER